MSAELETKTDINPLELLLAGNRNNDLILNESIQEAIVVNMNKILTTLQVVIEEKINEKISETIQNQMSVMGIKDANKRPGFQRESAERHQESKLRVQLLDKRCSLSNSSQPGIVLKLHYEDKKLQPTREKLQASEFPEVHTDSIRGLIKSEVDKWQKNFFSNLREECHEYCDHLGTNIKQELERESDKRLKKETTVLLKQLKKTSKTRKGELSTASVQEIIQKWESDKSQMEIDLFDALTTFVEVKTTAVKDTLFSEFKCVFHNLIKSLINFQIFPVI